MATMTLQDRRNDCFEQIMHNGPSRANSFDKLMADIQSITQKDYSEENITELRELLLWYEIEDGVSVFKTPEKPNDKEFIGVIDLPVERMYLYWGENRSAKSQNKYSLGIHFKYRGKEEVASISADYFKKYYPTLCNDILMLISTYGPNDEYTIIVYPKAGDMYKNVINSEHEGVWLIQTPSKSGQFVPNKGIGFFFPTEKVFHIFEPKPCMVSAKKYERKFKLIS